MLYKFHNEVKNQRALAKKTSKIIKNGQDLNIFFEILG